MLPINRRYTVAMDGYTCLEPQCLGGQSSRMEASLGYNIARLCLKNKKNKINKQYNKNISNEASNCCIL